MLPLKYRGGSGFSPAAGQKNGRSNRQRNFYTEVSYERFRGLKVQGSAQLPAKKTAGLIDEETLKKANND